MNMHLCFCIKYRIEIFVIHSLKNQECLQIMLLESDSPPASPITILAMDIMEEQDQEFSFRWNCDGNRSKKIKVNKKFVRNGELEQTLTAPLTLPMRICSVLVHERHDTVHLQDILGGFCQHVAILKLSQDRTVQTRAAKEIVHCVHHIRNVVQARVSQKMDCTPVLEIVKEIVYQMESLAEYDAIYSSQLLHAWLDIRWTLLVTLNTIPDKLQPNESLVSVPIHSQSWTDQLVIATLLDMLHLASHRGSCLEITHKTVSQLTVFGCQCIEEMWVCMFSLCHRRNIDIWNLLESCFFQQGESPVKVNEYSDMSVTQYFFPTNAAKEKFLMTFLSSIVTLLHSSQSLTEDSKQPIQNFVKKVVKNSLSEVTVKPEESRLRLFLRSLQIIMDKIGPSLEIISELWKHFSQITVINSSCRLKDMTLIGTTSIPSSSAKWLEVIHNIEDNTIHGDPNSFVMFSQLCSCSIQFWNNNNVKMDGAIPKESKAFMGRISAKLNPRKLKELNEYGIFHLSTLLLVLTSHQPRESSLATLSGQMLSATSECYTVTSASQLLTCLKSALTMCLLQVNRQHNINDSGLGDQISQVIETIVTRFKSQQSDVSLKRLCQDVVKIYVEALTEISETSESLSCGEETLISDWLAQYLNICSDNEISSVMTAVSILLTRCRVLLAATHQCPAPTLEQAQDRQRMTEVVRRLWTVVYPALKQVSTCLTAPAAVGSVVADFMLLKAESDGRGDNTGVSHSLGDMIKFFTQNKLVPVEISATVLYNVTHTQAVETIVSRPVLVSSLGVCSATAVPDTAAYDHVRRAWYQVVGGQDDSDTDTCVLVLLHSMSTSDIVSRLVSVCCDQGPQWRGEAGVIRQYQVLSWILYHCSHLIYTPSNSFGNQGQGLLTKLLGDLVTPSQAFDASWNMTLQRKKAIRKALPLMLKGIVGHKNFFTEKFLQRKFSEIIKIYVPKFDCVNHPCSSLLKSPSIVEDNQELASVVVEITLDEINKISREYLKSNRHLCVTVLRYLEHCLQTPQSCLQELLISRSLTTLLELMSSADDKNVSNPIMTILKNILDGSSVDWHLQTITNKLEVFIKSNLAFNYPRVFNTLKVLKVLNKNVVWQILTFLSNEVETVEKKRGSGNDSKLRAAFRDLERTVIEN